MAEQIIADGRFSGLFPGWGQTRIVAMRSSQKHDLKVIADTDTAYFAEHKKSGIVKEKSEHKANLNTLLSMSIAGCDLMGSCLYTAGVCTFNAGKLAPLSLTSVTIMLYYFRKVYSEAVTAIPVNGGTYNIVLNITSKKVAAFVACLSVLSYTATAIVSAFDSVVYLQLIWPDVQIRLFTILILALFACVTICGVGESSYVACVMFMAHNIVLTVLIIWGFVYGCQDNFRTFKDNIHSPYPTIVNTSGTVLSRHNAVGCLFFGYCSALLGITGFETAANYVEEMKSSKVFVSTVNAMWILVGIYNPLISIMSMMVMPMNLIYEHPSDMLAVMADVLGGNVFRTILCVDAVVVLCGGVLTAIVGVSSLMCRLAADNVLPSILARKNTRQAPWISIIVFVGLSMSLFLAIFDPKDPTAINNFGGVFAIAFLSVLVAFAMSTILLKLHRSRLARRVIARWWEIIVSLLAVSSGFFGNIVLTPQVFTLFLAYLSGYVAVCMYMFSRVELLSFGIWMLRKSYLTDEKRKIAAEEEIAILQAARKQDEYSELAHLEAADEEHGGTAGHVTVRGRRFSFDFGSGSGAAKDGYTNPNTNASAGGGGGGQGGESHSVFDWGLDVIQNVKRRLSAASIESLDDGNVRAQQTESLAEIETVLRVPVLKKLMHHFMSSLDSIVSSPFVYLAKGSDPISLQLAIEYITANELTANVIVVHFVDDRKEMNMHRKIMKRVSLIVDRGEIGHEEAEKIAEDLVKRSFTIGSSGAGNSSLHDPHAESNHRASDGDNSDDDEATNIFELDDSVQLLSSNVQQLIKTTALLDTFHAYQKISCVVVRGTYFCPSAVECISEYLGVPRNNMIIGVPGIDFAFPLADLKGVRLAVRSSDQTIRKNTCAHLRDVVEMDHGRSDDESEGNESASPRPRGEGHGEMTLSSIMAMNALSEQNSQVTRDSVGASSSVIGNLTTLSHRKAANMGQHSSSTNDLTKMNSHSAGATENGSLISALTGSLGRGPHSPGGTTSSTGAEEIKMSTPIRGNRIKSKSMDDACDTIEGIPGRVKDNKDVELTPFQRLVEQQPTPLSRSPNREHGPAAVRSEDVETGGTNTEAVDSEQVGFNLTDI